MLDRTILNPQSVTATMRESTYVIYTIALRYEPTHAPLTIRMLWEAMRRTSLSDVATLFARRVLQASATTPILIASIVLRSPKSPTPQTPKPLNPKPLHP